MAAQVAISTITTGVKDDKTELSKKLQKIISSVGDKVSEPSTSGLGNKCSVQEGVRTMAASMLGQPKAQAILNPPANVQKAVVVTQSTSTAVIKSKELADTRMNNQQETKLVTTSGTS